MRLETIFVYAIGLFMLSACVTQTISPYEKNKDLEKAELDYIELGYIYFENKNWQLAKKSLVTALDINKKSSGAHMGLARVYEREMEYELADKHFRKAIRYQGETEAYFQYGVYLYNRGDFRKAYKMLSKTLEDTLYDRRPQAFEFQAIIASRLDMADESIQFYKRAIALRPNMPNAYLGLARAYHARSEFEEAYTHYRGFVDLVRQRLTRHHAASVWLGIQLAYKVNDQDALSSLTIMLKNQYSQTKEYKQYLEWVSGQASDEQAN